MRGNTTGLKSFAVVVVAALAVAGCGGESPPTTPGSAGSSSSAAATSESASPSPIGTPEPPSGSDWVVADKTGIRFPVPEDWKSLSFREVLEAGDEKAIAEAAKTMGVTPDQLDDLADQIEVIVFGPTLKNFAVNINAIPQPGVAMPSAKQAASQLEQIGGEVGTPKTGTTAFGASLVVPYTLQVRGTTVQGRSILLETPDGIATLTVSHVSAKEADKLTQDILDNVGAL
jgi:hypothetical protein